MSQPSNIPFSTGRDGSAEAEAAHDAQADRDTGAGHDTRTERLDRDRTDLVDPAGEPDPLDVLRAELALIDQQPVVDRVARFEHANLMLAAALAELDEV